MADYEIKLDDLNGKKDTFNSMTLTVDQINDTYDGSTIKDGKDGYDNVATKITNNMTRLSNGYVNSNSWFTSYLSELTALEESLEAFTAANLTAPIEFSGTFEDIFGKVTIPAIKTGGDPNCNKNLGPSELGNTQAKEFYELGDRAYQEWQEYTEDSARGEWIK